VGVRGRGHAAVRELERRTTPDPAGDEATHQFAAAVLEEVGPTGVGELLDIGTGAGSLMAVLARRARHAVGIDISAPALRLARARVHGAGFSHCEFHRGDMYELPCEDAAFDTVTMDRVLGDAQRPADAIGEAARVLRRGGRLIVIERFDRLDEAPTQPLQQLRRWFTQAGLETQRLRPCDLDCGHYLIATARRAAAPGPKESLR
jgi:ubiquinone/menaquinone biosynthesis C-methylase UbiE